jgi:hypothetical protein
MVALLVLGAVFIGVGAVLGLGVAWVVYMLVEDSEEHSRSWRNCSTPEQGSARRARHARGQTL